MLVAAFVSLVTLKEALKPNESLRSVETMKNLVYPFKHSLDFGSLWKPVISRSLSTASGKPIDLYATSRMHIEFRTMNQT